MTAEHIIETVTKRFGVKTEDLTGVSRRVEYVYPRRLAMWFIKKEVEIGTTGIGKIFNRDHATVIHALRVTEKYKKNHYTKDIEGISRDLRIPAFDMDKFYYFAGGDRE